MTPAEPPVRLAPPGAGIPWIQRLAARWVILPRERRRVAWNDVPAELERQAARLFALADGVERPALERRVLVPPQPGLEDSSRYQSFAMVLAHLEIVGDRIANAVTALGRGRVPGEVVRTEDLKAPEVAFDVAADGYRAMLARFREKTLAPDLDRDSPARYAHPWFGPLDARNWMVFAPMHQQIHLLQASRIVRELHR